MLSLILDTHISGLEWYTTKIFIYFWMLETNIFIKDTTKILANISEQICKHKCFPF